MAGNYNTIPTREFGNKNEGRRIVVSFEDRQKELLMLCPRCGTNQSDEMKFCKSCGANLQAVREALAHPEMMKTFDRSDTWLAEMFRSGQAAELRKLEMERRMGITPAVKRYNEIKAGVIVSSVGIGLMIFLALFMEGLISKVSPEVVPIIERIWLAGVIPFFVGVALIINGVVVSKKMVEIQEHEMKRGDLLEGEVNQTRGLRPADTNEFIPTSFSVTEQTTRHLAGSEHNPKQ
jgi:zinc ribbon protein